MTKRLFKKEDIIITYYGKGWFRVIEDQPSEHSYVRAVMMAHQDATLPKSKKLKNRCFPYCSCTLISEDKIRNMQMNAIKDLEEEITRRLELIGILFPETIKSLEPEVKEAEEEYIPPSSNSLLRGD